MNDYTPGTLKDGEEIRTVDPKTGGMKGRKLAEVGALDPLALLQVAKVAGYGGQKYERLNYMKGYDWSLSFDALQRHALLFWSGEDDDPESGLPHMAHAAWHCLALLAFAGGRLGTDNRYHPNYQDVVRSLKPVYYSTDDLAWAGPADSPQDVPEYEDVPPCDHPSDKRYASVAGTENCGVCFQVLVEAKDLELVEYDEPFDAGCPHPRCVKTKHEGDVHEDWLGTFHERAEGALVGHPDHWGDV